MARERKYRALEAALLEVSDMHKLCNNGGVILKETIYVPVSECDIVFSTKGGLY